MKKWLCLLMALCCLSFAYSSVLAETTEIGTAVDWSEDWPYAPHKDCYLPDDAGYHDDSIDIRIETFRKYDTTIMVAYVKIQDPRQLRTGLAGSSYPSKAIARVDSMAKKYNAVLAINGDFFNYHAQGIVVRNGKLLRDQPNVGRDTLIIDDKGDFHIISDTTQEAFDAFEGTVEQAFCFGPGLVIDGVPLTDLSTVTLDCGKERTTQRIAIAQMDTLSYMIVTCEGPENKGSVGLNLLQMAEVCYDLGAVNCYNLDGGSSSTIALNFKKINALSSHKNRSVGDTIYFTTLVP